jgi:hypothetical protein
MMMMMMMMIVITLGSPVHNKTLLKKHYKNNKNVSSDFTSSQCDFFSTHIFHIKILKNLTKKKKEQN